MEPTLESQTPAPVKPPSWQLRFFTGSIRYKRYIYWGIRVFYAFILGILLLSVYAAITRSPDFYSVYYGWAIRFAQTAIVLLGVVILPGILGRFGLNLQATRIITFFRRQVGISVFLLVFTHYSIMRLLPVLSGQVPFVFPYSQFEMFGFFAICILFLMYLTSNNWSMAKFGFWWKRLHRFVYVVLWLLVLHTGLQRVSTWSVLIFLFALLETLSLLFVFLKKKQAGNGQVSTK